MKTLLLRAAPASYRWGQSSGKMTGSNAKPKADLAGLSTLLPTKGL